ncbi:major facilitator superfamily domain-containing protein [Globomyces pollinis-pini]|nr:major facilitator superfamily domain-containing protein [Globomyces pollinis-pini]
MSNQTKLPLLPVLVAATIMFCNTFMNTVLLPFLSFMIDDFHVAPNHDDIGTYSGYLVASFMLGQLIFSYSWGLASDRLGRRPILLVGLFLTAFSFLAFGFSTTYPMAIALRSLNGSVNGIVGVCKTFLSEITDNSNQGQGFSIFGVARGLGMIVGPVVGGYLSNPHTKYPKWFPKDSLFYTFPYALPTVIGCIIALSATIIGYFVLEETNQLVLRKNQMSNDSETAPLLLNQDQSMDQVEVEDNVDTHTHGNGDKGLLNVLDKATSLTSPNDNNSDDLLTGSTDLTKSTHDLNDLAIHTGSDDDRLDQSSVCTVDSLTVEHHTNHLVTTISTTDNIVNPSTLNNHSSINTSATASIETQPNASIIVSNTTPNSSTLQPLPKNLTTYQLIMTKRVFYSLILYGSVAFLYIQYDELFALWSRLPFEEGGLDFNSADQGFAFAIAGVALFLTVDVFFLSDRTIPWYPPYLSNRNLNIHTSLYHLTTHQ